MEAKLKKKQKKVILLDRLTVTVSILEIQRSPQSTPPTPTPTPTPAAATAPPRPDGGSHDIGKKILIPALPIWCQIPVEPVRGCRTRQRKLGQIWLWRSRVSSLAQSR